MKRLAVISLLFFPCGYGNPIQESNRIYRSGTYLMRGDTGVSRTEDQEAIFYNPAGVSSCELAEDKDATLCDSKGKLRRIVVLSPTIEVSQSYGEFSEVAGGSEAEQLGALKSTVGTPAHVGAYNFLGAIGDGWAGGFLTSGAMNLLIYRNADLSSVETIGLIGKQSVGPVGSYSMPIIANTLVVGTTIKYLKRTQTSVDLPLSEVDSLKSFKFSHYQNSGWGLGVDVGAIYQMPIKSFSLNFGLTITDVGDTSFAKSKSDGIPIDADRQSVSLGTSAKIKSGLGTSTAQLDYRDVLGRSVETFGKRLHLGIDHRFGPFGAGVGLNQGYSSVGILFDSNYFRADLGVYTEEIGNYAGDRSDPRYFFRFSLQI